MHYVIQCDTKHPPLLKNYKEKIKFTIYTIHNMV